MSDDVQKKDKPISHHTGHRERLRERFIKTGSDGMQDYELLEMLLFYAIPRRDVKPIAKDLLSNFGGLQQVMAASVHDLQQVKGVSENVAVMLKCAYVTAQRMLKDDITKKPVINSWQKLMDYCHVSMAYENSEYFRVLYLNRKNELLADEAMQKGTVDHAPVYPREILKSALEKGATAVILVHNHPSGDSTPSDSDILMTKEIVAAAKSLHIAVHDHIIISKNGNTSFKSLGLL